MDRTNTDNVDDIHVAAAILSKRYEDQLLKQGAAHNRVVPALVITGFLGAGKTTLLQHLLAAAGNTLKLGVLVNEVAQLDVDSQLLNTTSSNAAAGIKATQLSGGCACCAVSDDLKTALDELTASSNYQQLDYLLLETSGVADAEPLAAHLINAGFRLTGVVTVVDAEAGPQVLREGVAQAQLRAADVVVLNKCDLASLGGVSDVEDQVQQLTPGVRMLRARYGQVPVEAFLDLDIASHTAADGVGAAEDLPAEAGGRVQGEIAFLSHEPIVSTAARFTPKRGTALVRRRAAPISSTAVQSSSDHSHHDHFCSVSFISSEPLCMACFQHFVAHHLIPSTGLFRAKGFVWFQQQRHQRYVFHLSGKQRAECGCEGPWPGPPGVQLVMIGQHRDTLQHLEQRLLECVVDRCECSGAGNSCILEEHRTVAAETVSAMNTQTSEGPWASATQATYRLTQLINQHHRFEVATEQSPGPAPHQAKPDNTNAVAVRQGPALGLVRFSAIGSPLHGVVPEQVNAAILRKVNSTPGMFLCHINSPAALHSGTGQLAHQGVADLALCVRATANPKDAERWWTSVQEAIEPLLKKHYQHVHNCKCDVAAAAAYASY